MLLFATAAGTSAPHLGRLVLEALDALPRTAPRVVRAVPFDDEDVALVLRALRDAPGGVKGFVGRVGGWKPSQLDGGLYAFAVVGIVRYHWRPSEHAGASAMWPIVAQVLGARDVSSEEVAKSFDRALSLLGLAHGNEGHHRVRAAFRHAGWPRGLLVEWFRHCAEDAHGERPSVRLSEVLEASSEGESREIERRSRSLVESLRRGQEDAALVAEAEELAELGLAEDPGTLLEEARRALSPRERGARLTVWRWALQRVADAPRNRLVLARPWRPEEDQDLAEITGPSGGRCRVPPTAGRAHLVLPVRRGEAAALAEHLRDGGVREIEELPAPYEVAVFGTAGRLSEDLYLAGDLVPGEPCFVAVPAGASLRDEANACVGEGPEAVRAPAGGKASDAAVWRVAAAPATLEVVDAEGKVLERLVGTVGLPAVRFERLAPVADGPVKTVTSRLPLLAAPNGATSLEVVLEPAGPSTLAGPIACVVPPGATGNHELPLEVLLPEAATAFGHLRLRVERSGASLTRQFVRLPAVVFGAPENAVDLPGVWVRGHETLERVQEGEPPRTGRTSFVRTRQAEGLARVTLELRFAGRPLRVELGWPHRPLSVELVCHSPLDTRHPEYPRVAFARLLSGVAGGADDEGIAISAPAGTRVTLDFLDGRAGALNLGRRGRTFFSAAWLESWLSGRDDGALDRLHALRFAAPVEVTLALPGESSPRTFLPVAFWGREAPTSAELCWNDAAVEVRLLDVPEPWLAGLDEEPEAHLRVHAAASPWKDAVVIPALLERRDSAVILRSAVPLPRVEGSVRSRTKSWPRRFGLQVGRDGSHLAPHVGVCRQLATIVRLGGGKVTDDELERPFLRGLSDAEAVDEVLDAVADALRTRRSWPPEEAFRWLAGEVGEEPLLATPAPMLLARTSPGPVILVAARAVEEGRVSLGDARDWLRDLRLDAWMLTMGMLRSWPTDLDEALGALIAALAEAPQAVVDGWFRVPWLLSLVRGRVVEEAILEHALLLGRCGVTVAALAEVLSRPSAAAPRVGWPSAQEALELKGGEAHGHALSYARLWLHVQGLLQAAKNAPTRWDTPGTPRAPEPPAYLAAEVHRVSASLARRIAELGWYWSRRAWEKTELGGRDTMTPFGSRDRRARREAARVSLELFAQNVVRGDLAAALAGR